MDDRLVWVKSTRSGPNNNCVEVARPGGRVLVRDSKNLDAGHLAVSPSEWRRFLADLGH